MAWNSARLTAPSLSASRRSKRAARRSAVKASSSRPVASGRPSRKPRKAALPTPPGPAGTCLKRSSTDSSFSRMCSRSRDARVPALASTRNSSPSASTSGAHASVACLTSSSALSTISVASFRAFLAVYFASYAAASCLCLASATPASFDRFARSCKASLKAAAWPRLSSRCRWASDACACPTLSCAPRDLSTSVKPACSSSSSASGGSSPFLAKGAAAASSRCSSASAAPISPAASCISAVAFRLSMSFLNWASFAAAALMPCVISAKASWAGLEAASPKRLTSRFLDATRFRASPTAACTAEAAASEALRASLASSGGRTSRPVR
mmetsp:Transcript_95484/g.206008  ORF Transcript_95484/g.206008 Transcript_95484/m.206008 type:complete len:327 (-) Transcript_95484:1219-2199(-)